MTVKELIERLQTENPDDTVVIEVNDDYAHILELNIIQPDGPEAGQTFVIILAED